MPNRDTPNQHDEAFLQHVIAVFGRTDEMSFDEVVRQYREIETEFVALAGNDENLVLERKQSITNHLLMDAENSEQPHAVCRKIWEEVLQQGFTSVDQRHSLSATYARCCQFNGEFHAGLAVLEPLIAELEMLLGQDALTQNHRAFCEQFLNIHRQIRNELKTGIQEPLAPDSRELENK